jgi:hypothetical protein
VLPFPTTVVDGEHFTELQLHSPITTTTSPASPLSPAPSPTNRFAINRRLSKIFTHVRHRIRGTRYATAEECPRSKSDAKFAYCTDDGPKQIHPSLSAIECGSKAGKLNSNAFGVSSLQSVKGALLQHVTFNANLSY